MNFRSRKHAVLTLLIVSALTGAVTIDVMAQGVSRGEERRSQRSNDADRSANGKSQSLYPNATRQEPQIKASSRLSRKLQRMVDVYNSGEDYPLTRTLADEILADAHANEYEKSLAAQLAAQAAYSLDDNSGAVQYLKQVLEFDGLDNNGHYQSLLMLAQLQAQDEAQLDEGMASLDRYLSESGSQRAEDLVLKGQLLYQTEKFQEAIPVLEQAIKNSDAPKDSWAGLLIACYLEANQPEQAVAMAEQLAEKSPSDKEAQMRLVSTYLQAERPDAAAATLEKLRRAGQMTGENEYRQLYITYANMDGREADVIAVINEGLNKGILKPDYQAYLALAQSYYYSDQIPQAIENWQKAAPLSDSGETYLNLARALWQEGRIPEARQAAQQALDKGVRNPADAQTIINLK